MYLYTYNGGGQCPAQKAESDCLQKRQDVENVKPVNVYCAAHQINDVRTVHG